VAKYGALLISLEKDLSTIREKSSSVHQSVNYRVAWQPFTENKSQKKRQLESAAPIKSFIVTALLAYRLCLSLSTGYGTFRRTYVVV
jgi:hypothetical protein